MRRLPLLLLTGCATAGTFQRADTLGPGGWEVGGDLSALVIVDPDAGYPAMPLPRVAGRAGVGERVDLGGSVGLDGLRGQAKFQLTSPQEEAVVVSVSPGVRLLPLASPGAGLGALAGLDETLYLGLRTAPLSQLVLTARSVQDGGFVDGNQALLVWAGGGVGWSVRGKDGLRVMPEIGAMTPVMVLDDGRSTGAQGVVVQAGVALLLGSK